MWNNYFGANNNQEGTTTKDEEVTQEATGTMAPPTHDKENTMVTKNTKEEEEKEEEKVPRRRSAEELSFTKPHEPDTLVGGTPPSHKTVRGSDAGRRESAAESRELRGLAKRMDEEDRIAKSKARHSVPLGGCPVPPIPSTSSHSTGSRGNTNTAAPLSPQHRMTMSQEKRRATYLQTGMKPGAYPDKGPYESEADRPFVESRQYNPQVSMSDSEAHVPSEKEQSITLAPETDNERDIEQGSGEVMYGPLVEAFVVPDEQPSVSAAPPVKASSRESTLVDGDRFEKPHMARDESESDVKVTDILLHKNMLCLIGGLVCVFVVVTVIVVVVVMTTVVGGGGDSSSNQVQVENTNAPANGSLGPTEAPVILPELTETPTSPTNATVAPTVLVDDESSAPSETPSSAPVVTATPTLGPTDAVMGTTSPTEAPTPNPTTLPPTPNPTTLAPTPAQTTPAPTLAPVVSTPAATTSPVAVPANAIRTNITAIYTIQGGGEASAEEQELLDDALVANFKTELEEGLAAANSQSTVLEGTIVSSDQRSTSTGWWQSVVVDYTFDNGVPAVQTVIDSFENEGMALAYLQTAVNPLGPYFANARGIRFDFEFP